MWTNSTVVQFSFRNIFSTVVSSEIRLHKYLAVLGKRQISVRPLFDIVPHKLYIHCLNDIFDEHNKSQRKSGWLSHSKGVLLANKPRQMQQDWLRGDHICYLSFPGILLMPFLWLRPTSLGNWLVAWWLG